MKERMIILSKPDKSKKNKKVTKEVTELLQAYGANPLAETLFEMEFIFQMDDENMAKALKQVREFAEENGYEVEVLDDENA